MTYLQGFLGFYIQKIRLNFKNLTLISLILIFEYKRLKTAFPISFIHYIFKIKIKVYMIYSFSKIVIFVLLKILYIYLCFIKTSLTCFIL